MEISEFHSGHWLVKIVGNCEFCSRNMVNINIDLRLPTVWIFSELLVILRWSLVRETQEETLTFVSRLKLLVEISVRLDKMSSSKSENSSQRPRLRMVGVPLRNSDSLSAETLVLFTSRYLSFKRDTRQSSPASVTKMEPCTSRLAATITVN